MENQKKILNSYFTVDDFVICPIISPYLLNFDTFYSVTISFMETFTNVPILRQIKVE